MIRVRFLANRDDPAPVNWPVRHPFWLSGECGVWAIVVSYADDEQYIYGNWPEAHKLDIEEVDSYVFTSRFPRPAWFREVPDESDQTGRKKDGKE